MKVREAFEVAVVRRIPQDSSGTSLRKQVIDAINVQLDKYSVRRFLETDIFEDNDVPTSTNEIEDAPTYLTLLLSRNPSTSLLTAQCIKLIRQLHAVDEDGKETEISLSDANAMVNRISKLDTVGIRVAAYPDKKMITNFSVSGIIVELP